MAISGLRWLLLAALLLGLVPPGLVAAQASATADSTEARTLRHGLAERLPGESVTAFLGRVLPVSFTEADKPISYVWHPSDGGPQLFFSAPAHGPWPAELELYLFVFDPISPTQYAVQSFGISQADYTTLNALFFADANHDGKKDLLALTQCDLREYVKVDGQLMPGRFPHYQTTAIYYRGRDARGRPRYEQQYREDLDELSTAAEVRQALAAPPRRGSASAAKRNPRAKTAK